MARKRYCEFHICFTLYGCLVLALNAQLLLQISTFIHCFVSDVNLVIGLRKVSYGNFYGQNLNKEAN